MIHLTERDAEMIMQAARDKRTWNELEYRRKISDLNRMIEGSEKDGTLEDSIREKYIEAVACLKKSRGMCEKFCDDIILLMMLGSRELSEWKSLKKEKPKIGDRVLFCVSNDFVFEGTLLKNGMIRRNNCDNYEEMVMEKVQFWMPMPKGVPTVY